MAKQESAGKTYTDPITVRFDKETFEALSRIKLAIQQLTGAKMPMSALIAAAAKEYIANHAELLEAKPRRKPEK